MSVRFLLILCSCQFVFGMNIQAQQAAMLYCKFPAKANGTIELQVPVNRVPMPFDNRQLYLSATGEAILQLFPLQTGYVVLFTGSQSIKLMIQPGDSIWVQLDSTKEKALQFKGRNASGQELLNSPDFPVVANDALLAKYGADTSVQSLVTHAESDKSAIMEKAGALYDRRVITESFFNLLKWNVDYVYATVIANRIGNLYRKAMREPAALAGFKSSFGDYWSLLFNAISPNDPKAIELPALDGYVQEFIQHYLPYQQTVTGKLAGLATDPVIEQAQYIQQQLTGAVAPSSMARLLYRQYLKSNFQPSMVKAYQLFLTIPGANTYTNYLAPWHKKVLAFNKMPEQ